MMPSLARTVALTPRLTGGTAGRRRIELWVYVAWDAGDEFYDAPGRADEMRQWMQAARLGWGSRPGGVGVTRGREAPRRACMSMHVSARICTYLRPIEPTYSRTYTVAPAPTP